MAGPFPMLRVELRPAIKGALGKYCWWALKLLGSEELACGWAGHPPLLAGFQGPD